MKKNGSEDVLKVLQKDIMENNDQTPEEFSDKLDKYCKLMATQEQSKEIMWKTATEITKAGLLCGTYFLCNWLGWKYESKDVMPLSVTTKNLLGKMKLL